MTIYWSCLLLGILPAFLPLIAAGLSAAAAGGGAALSAASNKSQIKTQTNLQEHFAKHGVQWRVEDAQRAGVHPLAALGMMPTHSQPVVLGDPIGPALADAGQDISRALTSGLSEEQKTRGQLENKLLESQIGETDMRKVAIAQQIQRDNQPINRGIGVMPETRGMIEGQAPVSPGLIDLEASKVTDHQRLRRSTEAGIKPGEEEITMGDMPIVMGKLGGEGPEEVISEIHPLTWAAILQRNSNLRGKGWLKDFLMSRYAGVEPEMYWPGLVEQQGMGKAHLGSDVGLAVDRAMGAVKHYRSQVHAPKWFRQFQRDLWMENQGKRRERR